jgi:hypothetical protein
VSTQNNNRGVGILRCFKVKVPITNLYFTKLAFIRKFRPKLFHQIDSRSDKNSERFGRSKFSPQTKRPLPANPRKRQRPISRDKFCSRIRSFVPR